MTDYSPQTWADLNASYPLSAARMTVIENGIVGSLQKSGGTLTGEVRSTLATSSLYIDTENNFFDRKALMTVERNVSTVQAPIPNIWSLVQGKGDNTNFRGVSSGYFQARDRSDVTGSNKGILYGLQVSLVPIVARAGLASIDDVVGLVISNDAATALKATEGIFIGHNTAFTSGAKEFFSGVGIDANADYCFRGTGTYEYGLDLAAATINQAGVRIPNNKHIKARNAANNADMQLIGSDGSDEVVVGLNASGCWCGWSYMTLTNASGMKLGNAASEKLGFWGRTPIARPTGWAAATGTATRATFATSTVTLPVLAEHVKALIDDFMDATNGIGLIGA